MKVTKEELHKVITQVIEAAERQATYRCQAFEGLTEKQLAEGVCAKLGRGWQLSKGERDENC